MNKEENRILLKNFIKSNPFDFRQGIISHCRQMDKADVYEWLAEDELKIKKLQNNRNELKKWLEEEITKLRDFPLQDVERVAKRISLERTLKKLNKLEEELERGEE